MRSSSPPGISLSKGDAERASHQQHLVEPGLAQAGLKLADSAFPPGTKPVTAEHQGYLLLRQALAVAFRGHPPCYQVVHLHPPSIYEQSR